MNKQKQVNNLRLIYTEALPIIFIQQSVMLQPQRVRFICWTQFAQTRIVLEFKLIPSYKTKGIIQSAKEIYKPSFTQSQSYTRFIIIKHIINLANLCRKQTLINIKNHQCSASFIGYLYSYLWISIYNITLLYINMIINLIDCLIKNYYITSLFYFKEYQNIQYKVDSNKMNKSNAKHENDSNQIQYKYDNNNNNNNNNEPIKKKQGKSRRLCTNTQKKNFNFININIDAEQIANKLSESKTIPIWLLDQSKQKQNNLNQATLDITINNNKHFNARSQQHSIFVENKIKMRLLSIDDQIQEGSPSPYRYSRKQNSQRFNAQFLIEPFNSNFNDEGPSSLSNTMKIIKEKLKSQPNQKNQTQPMNFLSHSMYKRKIKKQQKGQAKKNNMSNLKEVLKKLENIQNYIKPTLDAFPISKVNLNGSNYEKPRSQSSKLLSGQNPSSQQPLGSRRQSTSKKIQTQESQAYCGDSKQWKLYEKYKYKNTKNLNDKLLIIKNQQDQLIERLMKNQINKRKRQNQKQKCNKQNQQNKQFALIQNKRSSKYVPLSSTLTSFSQNSKVASLSSRKSAIKNIVNPLTKTLSITKEKSAQNSKICYQKQMIKQRQKQHQRQKQRQKCINLWKFNGVKPKDRKKLIQLLF